MSNFLDFFQCFVCNAIKVKSIFDKDNNNHEAIVCTECNTHFPYHNEILRFVNRDNYSNNFGFEWKSHSQTQLDSFSKISLSRDRFFQVTGWPERLDGEFILEAGCGSGRFTEILAKTNANIISFDYSDAIEVNFQNNNKYKNISFFQGDIFNLPLKKNSFDKVFCFGVIQHTPDPEEAIKNLIKYVKPNGKIAFDVYRKDFVALLQWKYLLRPITKKMSHKKLYKFISVAVHILAPLTKLLKKLFGRFGGRLSPIADYSELNISEKQNLEWSILDTFDRYSPRYDNPMTIKQVKLLLENSNLKNIIVKKGLNGIVAIGDKK